MSNYGWKVGLSAAISLLLCIGLYGQANQKTRAVHNDSPGESRTDGLSELARDNFNRVAASSIQIRQVLVRDIGLMVELKRWVAKEASDNGQVVEDSSLTDQAIFERLDRDVAFRSVATRLLQRYGYLMPTPNPESDYAKEQDLILKERARRFVQIEAQEDAQAMQAEKPKREERSADCDPQQGDICEQPPRARRQLPQNQPVDQDVNPFFPPMLMPPVSSQRPQTLRTDLGTQGMGPGDSQSGLGLQLTSMKKDSESMLDGQSASFSSSLSPGLPFGLTPGLTSGLSGGDSLSGPGLAALLANTDNTNQRIAKASIPQAFPRSRTPKTGIWETDVTPVKMVRTPNPYADVPSLYDMYVQAAASQRPAERFGLDVFRNSGDELDLVPIDLPVGPDYTVGPGDSLAIDLWGGVSQRLVRVVDREGRVSLPEAGPLLVSGKTLADVQLSVQHVLRSQFRDVSADVSLSRLRTIRVYIVGDVAEPGAYDISSLSTPLNALFAAGGVTGRGSLRVLKHYRGKELVQEVDAYDLLLHGVRSDLKRLENGDTLLVPPMGAQVTVEGMVRRPAVYELLNESSLAEVLELAGGILPTAALRHIEVQRIEQHEKRTMLNLEITETSDAEAIRTQLSAFKIQAGDQVHIFPIAAYNQDTIYLQGHVLRPGRYSYKQGMKLTDLIASYKDLLPEPAPHYAEIVRLNAPDFHPSVESFDLSSALATPASSPALRPLDTVRVFSRYDFEPPPDVWVGGEVRSPGNYRTSGQAHLRDAIYLAGGLTQDASLDTVQLFRTQSDGTMKILSVDLRDALAGDPVDNLILQPRDRLLVHKNPAKIEAPTVYIKGEVAKPGRYPLTDNMRVGDLVRVAGGLKRSAYGDQADLTRYSASNLPSRSNEIVEVKLAAALGGDANQNVPLQNGDVLSVRQVPHWNDLGASVSVRGEIQHPATYGIVPGERLSSILQRSGGFTDQAYPYGAVLIRKEVRELEMKSHLELIRRIKMEQGNLKMLPDGDADQKNAKLTAIAETETTLRQLEASEPLGRVVIHIPSDLKNWPNSAADVALHDGDELIIPKKPNYVMVNGQVFNPTAVSCLPGKSAKWYLSQAGGLTQMADKKAMFVVRADGSVISSKNNSGFWSGDPMNTVLKPGDTIVVPEKAPKVAPRNWQNLMQTAQIASSVALTVAYFKP